MARINYVTSFWDDMTRLTDFLMTQNTVTALGAYDIVIDCISLLKRHPEIGRVSSKNGLRELVISRGNTGYIALYEYEELLDLVTVLSIWHQRESGYH